jgi:hypothetical protein
MILSFIRSRYKRWVDKRYLKKHHCRSWEQYNHVYDEGRNVNADNLTDYYCGYNAIVHVRWAIVVNLPSWHDPFGGGYYELTNWCKEHCTDDFRLDDIAGKFINSKYVMADTLLSNSVISNQVFIAFKSEKDALLFKLRWI